jgi:hypothetical protein
MPKCPECGKPVDLKDEACKSCGFELEEAPPPPPKPKSDAAQYGIIIGIIVAIAVVLLIFSSAMGSTTCKDCKGKGFVKCLNCKDGRNRCIVCKGSGADPQTQSTCMHCGGKGVTPECERCKGQPKKPCPSCGGTGSR